MEFQELHNALSELTEIQSMKFLTEKYSGKVVFSTSFGYEDQVITHLIASNNIPISLFTLDTGRLFPETYSTWVSTQECYKINIKPYYPNADHIADFVEKNGPNAFYNSPELRKECCGIRKVEPLNKALKGQSVWITGLRASQSAARHDLPQLEWDEDHHLYKFHPVLHWSLDQVKDYILKNNIPY
ncbi:MAG: phosphoadenylyl-sulfate reductase, partial [Dysgonamonadaceae bacterium]